MKKIITIFIFLLISGVVWGQVSENFDGLSQNSYGNYDYNGFHIQNGLCSSTNARSGNAVRLRDATTYIEYQGGDGNGKDGGVGTITFWYRSWDGSPAAIYNVQASINGGSFSNIGSQINTTSTAYIEWSHAMNNASDNIIIRIERVSGERLHIDDFSITNFTGGVVDPFGFSASVNSSSQIDLSWTLNGNSNNVMIAVNSTNTFGDPSGVYSVSDPITGGGTVIYNSNGTSFNHTGLTDNTTYYYKAWSVDGTNTYSTGVTSNATTLKLEPTNYPTGPSAATGSPSHSSINVTWTDATGGTVPDGYLVKGSETSFAAIVDPIDGTAEADGGLVQNISAGVQSATFSGLNSETTYYFQIYPYTNSGSNINYKVGSEPQASATTDAAPVLPNAWINEIHYDNVGTDVNEAIEIIIQNSGSYSLADFSVDLYNGSGGASYSIETLDNFTVGDTDPTDNTFTYYYYNYTANSGSIQNGPDGMALSYQGTLIQFLSYGGTFAATDGAAIGVTSTDIGVSESSSPVGESLQLTGSGTQYSDFTWAAPATATLGSPNNNQALPVELTSFSALAQSNTVNLTWETATEVNNYGFEIERTITNSKLQIPNWENVGFVEGHGNSNSAKQYSYVDNSVRAGQSYSYRLKQIDFDGQFEYSNIVNVEVGVPMEFSLAQNYPNPFNPSTSIEYSVPSNEFVTLKVYDVLGNTVSTLVNENKEAGKYNVSFDASNLTSGIYFYSINAGGFTQVKKMMLVK